LAEASAETVVPEGGVCVWQAHVRPPAIERCLAVLDPADRARAAAFRSEPAQHAFVVGRGLTRTLLGRLLDIPAARVALDRYPNGKPRLAAEHRAAGLHFNLSHSGDVVLVAIARGLVVGIDVERCAPRSAVSRIASRFFSADEAAAIFDRPTLDPQLAFYRTWTRKEAFIKATGDGLSRPLDSFRVSRADEPPALVWSRQPSDLDRWTMAAVGVENDYEATLVIARPERGPSPDARVEPRTFRWP